MKTPIFDWMFEWMKEPMELATKWLLRKQWSRINKTNECSSLVAKWMKEPVNDEWMGEWMNGINIVVFLGIALIAIPFTDIQIIELIRNEAHFGGTRNRAEWLRWMNWWGRRINEWTSLLMRLNEVKPILESEWLIEEKPWTNGNQWMNGSEWMAKMNERARERWVNGWMNEWEWTS